MEESSDGERNTLQKNVCNAIIVIKVIKEVYLMP